MTLAEKKNQDQELEIWRAKRDFDVGISEKERDMMVHTMDLMGLDIDDRKELKSCRKRFLRDFY